MAGFLEALSQFLCYGNSECLNAFTQYSYGNQMEGLFYLVFFPSIFIILFIFILARRISPNKGLFVLLSVAFFAFIILQGFYYWFIFIGRYWFMGMIILGFLWLALHGLGGEKAKGRGGALGGIGSALGRRATTAITGEEHRLKDEIKLVLSEVDSIIKASEHGSPDAWRMAASVLERLHQVRGQLEKMMEVEGFVVGDFGTWDGKIKHAIERLQHVQAKAPKHPESK